ncbi:MAG: hypothetical protein CSA26_07335 [Desulfobacterales bacterium]|nr:MAG: hypothetical protein CSA26_07335 [Desulfobacterales bacterium]
MWSLDDTINDSSILRKRRTNPEFLADILDFLCFSYKVPLVIFPVCLGIKELTPVCFSSGIKPVLLFAWFFLFC